MDINKYIKEKAKSVNYKEFLDVVEGLILDKEIEIRKNWLEARTEIKFKSDANFKDINFVQLRKHFSQTYNLLVSKNDFIEVIEAIAESSTSKEESDEWIYIAREWLESNYTTEISTKELGSKCFSLTVKELNPKTLQRLSKVLRCNGFSQNTKTRKWSKLETSATPLPATLKPNDSKDSSVALSQCYSVLPIATKSYKEEFEMFKELYYKEKSENTKLLNNNLELANKIKDLEAKVPKEVTRFAAPNRFEYNPLLDLED